MSHDLFAYQGINTLCLTSDLSVPSVATLGDIPDRLIKVGNSLAFKT